MTPARSPYGDLADDVALLASDGKVIRRHDGMYRLDGAPEKMTAAMVRGMAAEVRNRRWEAEHAPRFQVGYEITGAGKPNAPLSFGMAAHAITKTAVLDTRPGEGGASGTNEGHDAAPAIPVCAKCGGPISKWSKGQCAVCYAQAGRGSYPQRPYAERPDKFWRAVERDAAPSGRVDAGVPPGVPPDTTPQTASGPGRSAVTPAPESGASA